VKVRNAVTGKTVVAFFVEAGATESLYELPNGAYRIQFALGETIDANCATFRNPISILEFPDPQVFRVHQDGPRIFWGHASLTLYAVPSGNARTRRIDESEFSTD
jgi:hypothetical protein